MNQIIWPQPEERNFSCLSWYAHDWKACYHYEFARESKAQRETLDKIRSDNALHTFPESLRYWGKQSARFWQDPYRWYFLLCPEWPGQPFKQNEQLHRERYKNFGKPKMQTESPAVDPWDFIYIISRYKNLVPFWEEVGDQDLEKLVIGDYAHVLYNGRGTITSEDGKEFVCFEIDWTAGRKQLVDEFRNWLAENYPTKKGNQPQKWVDPKQPKKPDEASSLWNAKPVESRGGASATSDFQKSLQALAAWRMWKAANGNWKAIKEEIHTKDELYKTAFREGFFNYKYVWTRAQAKVDVILSRFNSENFPF
jgi:hypothetical protein